MSNPEGPDRPQDATDEQDELGGVTAAADGGSAGDAPHESDAATEVMATADHEPETEIMPPAEPDQATPGTQEGERRFTAPSAFDAGVTQRIDTPPDPETEVFPPAASTDPKAGGPQVIPPRGDAPKPPTTRRSWGWVIALVLVIAALVAVAILGTVLLSRASEPEVSQEDLVRATIQNFDIAVQSGDLATLRSITCGATRDNYVKYDDRAWAETHARVAAAKQYPVVASIDQVVINGDHAEANVTTFMAFAPQTRSTRSFDLQFHDNQWKICQAPSS